MANRYWDRHRARRQPTHRRWLSRALLALAAFLIAAVTVLLIGYPVAASAAMGVTAALGALTVRRILRGEDLGDQMMDQFNSN